MRRVDLVNPRYRILTRGDLEPGKVWLDYDARQRLRLTEEQRRAVAEACQKLRAEGRRVENLPLYRYQRCTCAPRMLLLRLGYCTYEEYLGLNVLGCGEGLLRADALAVVAVTETPEGFALAERSDRVAEGAGCYHVVPSGHPHPDTRLDEALLEEAEAELGLAPDEVENLRCLGHMQVADTGKVEVLYRMSTLRTLEELSSRAREEAWESARLFTVSTEARPLADWLVEHFARTAPPGHAALVLEGARRYGEEWLEELWNRLGSRQPGEPSEVGRGSGGK